MKLKNKKILILGSGGFIGSTLLKFLKNKKLKTLEYSKKKKQNLLKLNHFLNFLNKNKPSIIINCAAVHGSVHFVLNNPAKVIFENMKISLNIYEAIKLSKLKNVTVINPLANCSYSGNDKIQREENWWNGIPHESSIAYGCTKRLLQVIGNSYEKQHKIISKNFLLPGVYGPNNHLTDEKLHALDGLILRMAKAKKNNVKIFKIWGSGKPIREWCYIDEVIKFIYLLITTNKKITYPINLAQKKGYSIKSLALIIKKLLKYDGKIFFDKKFPDGAKVKILDNKKFKKFFPKFKFTKIENGIKNSISYYKSKIN